MAYKNFKLTEMIDEIGSELRKARVSCGETLASVSSALSADGVALSPTMLGRIETGERRLDDDLFLTLCKYYKIDPFITAISAAKQYSERIQEHLPPDATDCFLSADNDVPTLISLYQNLNQEGQSEVRSLMRMMAYMNAFKKEK